MVRPNNVDGQFTDRNAGPPDRIIHRNHGPRADRPIIKSYIRIHHTRKPGMIAFAHLRETVGKPLSLDGKGRLGGLGYHLFLCPHRVFPTEWWCRHLSVGPTVVMVWDGFERSP